MGLTADEALQLSDEAADLWRALKDSIDSDGDGGKKITKAEGRKIIRCLAQLLWQLTRDILD